METADTFYQLFIEHLSQMPLSGDCLLAVSGGVDSVVMAHLFAQSGKKFSIAHCNFKLRGEASDADQTFVENVARELNVPFFSVGFETNLVAQSKKISIQMAARELRYAWLHQLADAEGFAHIATAHHLNDSIETLFLNLTKGCGIGGLHGIKSVQERVIRPLLFASKDDILQYASHQNIIFREDASNATDKYARNSVRHNVIPALKRMNPSFERTMQLNIRRFTEIEHIYNLFIEEIKSQIIEYQENGFLIKIEKLKPHAKVAVSILYEILNKYEYNAEQCYQIWETIIKDETLATGKQFFSHKAQLLLNRGEILVSFIDDKVFKNNNLYTIFEIEADTEQITFGQGKRLVMKKMSRQDFLANTTEYSAYFDADKLKFPLQLRLWQSGDHLLPFGMKGKKQKVKKILTDKKLSLWAKHDTWVLTSESNICWLLDHRTDERFKIDENTKCVVVCKYYDIL